MTLVIGLGHRARTGKDACAQAILEARGQRFSIKRYAFADALRAEVQEAIQRYIINYGMDAQEAVEELCNLAGVPYDQSAEVDQQYPYGKQRAFLQWYGSEYRRAQDPDYWVKIVARQIKQDSPQVAIISDMRFPNEARFVEKESQGITIKVIREGFKPVSEHHSETALESHKFMIELRGRDGELESLKQQAVTVFDALTKRLDWMIQ